MTLINKLIRYHLRVHSRPWWSIVLFRVNYNLLVMYKFRIRSVNTLLLTKINDKKTEVASYSHDHLGVWGENDFHFLLPPPFQLLPPVNLLYSKCHIC